MLEIKNGVVRHNRITRRIYPGIEHSNMENIHGIIIHQTSSNSTMKALFEYTFSFLNHGNGAHFLIDPSGLIYQTARLNKKCWHVGRIKSMCATVHSCSPKYQETLQKIDADVKVKKVSKEEAWKKIDLLEQAKDAKERYPTNHDSIGIELFGAPVQDAYLAPPPMQNDAAQWLLHELLDTFQLKIDHVYAHGFISPHKNQTEAGLFNYSPHN